MMPIERRKPSNRIVVAALVAALVTTACAADEEPGPTTAPSATPTSTGSPDPSPSPQGSPEEATELEVWLATENGLFPVIRSVPGTPAVGRAAVEELLAGPTAAESALGITSAVPEGTSLEGLDIRSGTATVDLSGAFDDGGGSASILTRLAQVVYTLTQFPTVSEVTFRVEGEPVETFSSEGVVLDRPQRRKDYRDLLPPIVVLEPAIGAEVTSPLTVSGTANVFEATVSLRLLVDGEVLADGFTTATCGTGCRGRYSHELAFSVAQPTDATLEVFESSAEDGSPLHVVTIPVRLNP